MRKRRGRIAGQTHQQSMLVGSKVSSPADRPTFRAIQGGRSSQSSQSARLGPPEISLDPSDAESSYPMSEFLVPSQDAHGHAAKVIARIPPSMKHEIRVVLEKGRFPWECESDFVRWCIYRGLDQVRSRTQNPEIISLHAITASWVSACREQEQFLGFQATLDSITATVSELLLKGAETRARVIVRNISESVDDIDDEFWRDRYRDQINDRFGQLLRRAKKIKHGLSSGKTGGKMKERR